MKFTSHLKGAFCILALLLVSNCSRTTQISSSQNLPVASSLPPPVPTIQSTGENIKIVSYVAKGPFARMSEDDKIIAAKTQYNALQFGRPGAPRKWTGTTGNKGNIVVGPFIQKNGLICRNFEHEVTVDQTLSTFSATACRSEDGHWTVEA